MWLVVGDSRGSSPGATHGGRALAAIILAMRWSRTSALAAMILALALPASALVLTYAHGASFVARAAGATGIVREIAEWRRLPVKAPPVSITWRGGTLRGRRYDPATITSRPLLLVPGVHASGIDEP